MMATAAARLRHFPLSSYYHHILGTRHLSTPQSLLPLVSLPHSSSSSSSSSSSPLLRPRTEPFLPNLLLQKFHFSCGASGNGSSDGVRRGSGGGGGGGWNAGENSDDSSSSSSSSSLSSWVGPIGAFLNGWRSRVAADPQFPFKVVMEELVGVSACVLGDMASRPNFGLNELDFVFSTLVVGCILNFVLMYLLAPTSSTTRTLPSVFANCPASHMFEPGPYGLLNRFGTFLYKGVLFAAVGFAAGLVGTAISNGLIQMRKKMDPNFETPNKPPPTILNAGTWAIHMGVSSNLRYQTLNGVEFLLANLLPPLVFKTSVVVVRCFNNVLGGMSFVILARLTGSQSLNVHEGKQQQQLVTEAPAAEMEKKLLNRSEDSSRSNQSS